MTDYYVGLGGNNSNSGLSWALRRLTLTSIETLVAAGDRVFVAPGVYRETLTATANGGNAYTTGTASVTKGSAVVTGSGTAWLANAFANGQFRITSLASGSDGVANGTTTFTSSAGNFQAGHVGLVIQVAGKGAYTITAVGSATSITLDGSPSAGSSLAYSIMSPVPVEIQSVDSNTQITLKQAWAYPSFTGLAYITYKDIKYIADVTGVNTDGVGGGVRITGSDNDQTATRTNVMVLTSRSYRTFRGFFVDTGTTEGIVAATPGSDIIIEDCSVQGNTNGVNCTGAGQLRWTIRRCRFDITGGAESIAFDHSSTINDANHVVENCIITARGLGIVNNRIGGVSVRNCDIAAGTQGVFVNTALAVGQAMVVNNCILYNNPTQALRATTSAEFVEDYNDIFAATTARLNVNVGSHSQAYPPLFQPLLLLNGSIFTLIPFSLSQWSPLSSIVGINQPIEDFYGTIRAATSSWGAVQYSATRRPNDAGIQRDTR